jgi:hypothetical protein
MSNRLGLHYVLSSLLGAIYVKASKVAFPPKVPTDYAFGGQYICLIGELYHGSVDWWPELMYSDVYLRVSG